MGRLCGLYAITPEVPAPRPPLAAQVERAIAGGARLVQYRDKSDDSDKRLQQAQALIRVCRPACVPLIINDDLDLAERTGADGVHLGKKDADPLEARKRLGPSAIVGVSCYNRLERAIHAWEIGADYAAFGRFFPSSTKPLAVQATPDLLRRARALTDIPLVAIGGITPENGRSLISAGADMLAVVDAVFGQPDIRSAALDFTRLFPDGDCDQ
jgi:thiamine-phosphate pyrophosphorylase